MRCEQIAGVLPGVTDGSTHLDRNDRRHVDRCLRCQAELAQYRKLSRAMASIRSAGPAAPAGLAATVLDYIEMSTENAAVRTTIFGRRVAYIGGIAAATAAAGAGAAIVLVNRGRRGRLPLAG